eukprot:1182640-Prorocentrum_minimum.AAC.5
MAAVAEVAADATKITKYQKNKKASPPSPCTVPVRKLFSLSLLGDAQGYVGIGVIVARAGQITLNSPNPPACPLPPFIRTRDSRPSRLSGRHLAPDRGSPRAS